MAMRRNGSVHLLLHLLLLLESLDRRHTACWYIVWYNPSAYNPLPPPPASQVQPPSTGPGGDGHRRPEPPRRCEQRQCAAFASASPPAMIATGLLARQKACSSSFVPRQQSAGVTARAQQTMGPVPRAGHTTPQRSHNTHNTLGPPCRISAKHSQKVTGASRDGGATVACERRVPFTHSARAPWHPGATHAVLLLLPPPKNSASKRERAKVCRPTPRDLHGCFTRPMVVGSL